MDPHRPGHGSLPWRPLMALALAAFAIGTTEFVIMGLLPEVARDLGASVPSAALLVSGYALGVAFGGPILAVAMAGMPGRRSLLWLIGLFVAGNVACALAPGYGWLMAARVLTAFCHAAFFGIGAVIAADLAPEGRRAQAISMMISGLTLANVLGVPLGTFLGQAGGWRATFAAVALAGVLAWAALASWLPADRGRPADLRADFQALLAPQVVLALATSVVTSASMFTFFTFVAPLLTEVSGVATSAVGWILLACGIGLTAGNLAGARLADRHPVASLAWIVAATAALLLAMRWSMSTPAGAAASVVAWGAAAFAACTVLQSRVVALAGRAANLASTLNISAFNLGNALGAGFGAAALGRGVGLVDIPTLAGGVALVALAMTLLAWAAHGRAPREGDAAADRA